MSAIPAVTDPVLVEIERIDNQITRELARLRAENESLRAVETITLPALVGLITGMFCAREGEILTQAMACERARDIASVLRGFRVLP